MNMKSKTDEELIAEAVASGRVRKIPMWETSDWESLSFRQRRSLVFTAAKRAKTPSHNENVS